MIFHTLPKTFSVFDIDFKVYVGEHKTEVFNYKSYVEVNRLRDEPKVHKSDKKKEKKKEKKEKRKAKELARSESSSDKKRSREEGEETEQKKKAKKDVVPFDYSAAAPELTPLTAMGGTSVELPNSNKPKKMQPAKPRPSAYEAPTVESFAPESLPNSKKIKSKAHMLSGNKSYSFLE